MNHCRKVILLLIVMVVGLTLSCRKPTGPSVPDTAVIWEKTYGDSVSNEGASSVQATLDGGFIIAGTSYLEPFGPYSSFLIKVNGSGDTIWAQGYEGTTACVQQTADGGYIVTGWIEESDDADVVLRKVDSDGTISWSKTIDIEEGDYAKCIKEVPDGGYIIVGTSYFLSLPKSEILLIRTDSNGDTLWTRKYGGIRYDEGNSVDVTSDSGFIVAGTYDNGLGDIWLLKLDSNGDTLWSERISGSEESQGSSVQETSDNHYIAAGRIWKPESQTFNIYLIKTDMMGTCIWSMDFGTEGNDIACQIIEDSDGNYAIAGCTYSNNGDVYMAKVNSSGDSIYAEAIGGDGIDVGTSICEAFDGAYVIAGKTNSYGAGGMNEGLDVYLIKLKPEQ